jgi:hypothetical protein
MSQLTDGELMAALSEREFGQQTAMADRPPPPSKPARTPRKPPNAGTVREARCVHPLGANGSHSNVE